MLISHLFLFADQPGIAIGLEIFEFLLHDAIQKATISGKPIVFQSNNDWDRTGLSVFFTMSIDASKMTVTLGQTTGPTPMPIVELQHLDFTLGISVGLHHDQGTPLPTLTLFSEHTVTYKSFIARFVVDKNKVLLNKQSIQSSWNKPANPPDPNEFWRNMTTLPDGSAFTQDLKDDWSVNERAYLLLAQDAMGTTFIESFQIPDILGTIKAFSFTGPIDIQCTPEIVMMTGRAEWTFDCPRRSAAAPTESLRPTALLADGPLPGEQDYPPFPKFEQVDHGDLFIHLPTTFMKHRFDNVAKPSITFSDEGTVAIIEWHYEASVAPKPGGTLQISLVPPLFPTQFLVSLPLQVFGSAGAGVEILCVRYDIVGARFNGEVDPFQAQFIIGLDAAREDLYFESKLGSVNPQNFDFDLSSPFGFPIDQIASVIISAASAAVAAGQAGRILNVTRFSIADFGLFSKFGTMRSNLAAKADAQSTTFGVDFDKPTARLPRKARGYVGRR
jgi:hypothetical protein